jgi:hypothetical protein
MEGGFKESISRKLRDKRLERRAERLRVWRSIMSGKRRMRPNAKVGAGKVKVAPAKKGNRK